jgi:hypothetical protein
VAINLNSSRWNRSLISEARRKQMSRVEELKFLKIISDTVNKSISMQNQWTGGGVWLDHTQHYQSAKYICMYIFIYNDRHRVQ